MFLPSGCEYRWMMESFTCSTGHHSQSGRVSMQNRLDCLGMVEVREALLRRERKERKKGEKPKGVMLKQNLRELMKLPKYRLEGE